MKSQIMADEKAALEPKRDAACKELLEQRKIEMKALNAEQKLVRAEFRSRIETGIDNADFLSNLAAKIEAKQEAKEAVKASFREASHQTTARVLDPTETIFFGKAIDGRLEPISREPWSRDAADRHAGVREVGKEAVRSSLAATVRPATKTIGGLVDGIFSSLTNLGSAQPEPVSAAESAELFREAAENALKQEQHRGKEVEDEAWRSRQKEFYRE